MQVLILGGTAFVGRHVTREAIARGHQVTLFHRGLSDPHAFPGVERIIGDRDRDEDLAKLRERGFDVVIDTGGYELHSTREAARQTAHPNLHYVFISSISVYAKLDDMHEEGSPLIELDDPEHAPLSLASYGGLKVACERAIEAVVPGRAQMIRAGLILGPHDYDERFRYWLTRIARGDEVLAPGNPDARVQFIDVRDLARWIVDCAERRIAGIFNATGPDEIVTMKSWLEKIREITGSDAKLTWVDDKILLDHQVGAYSEMPFWLPASLGHIPVDSSKAIKAGLEYRPFEETIRDTWQWLQEGWDREASARQHRKLRVPGGMTAEREGAVLAAAKQQR